MKKVTAPKKQTQAKFKLDEILVVTSDTATRGWGSRSLKVSELKEHMGNFLEQVGAIISKTPETVGSFRFEEFEISAQVTAKGSLALLGTGGEAGGSGGLKFVFRRSKPSA